MKLSSREYLLGWATAAIMLYGVTIMLATPSFRQIGKLRQERAGAARKLAVLERTIAQKQEWDTRLAGLQARLNTYPPGKDVTADMLIRLQDMEARNGLKILRREVEKESAHGDLYELAINYKWEGNLQSVVAFLFDLQGEGVMMDANQISIAPNEKRVLRGSMLINAAYCRSPAGGTNENAAKGPTP